jgi:flagellar biosynthesis protein FlgN
MGFPPQTSSMTEFVSSLHTERNSLRAFVTVLETEQRTLLEGKTDQLLALAETKTRLVGELTELGNRRRQYLSAHDMRPGLDDTTSWLKSHLPAELPAWNEIRRLAERAQQLNTTNGQLIQVKLRHNQQALTVLHTAAQGASLYGPDGQQNLSGMGKSRGAV